MAVGWMALSLLCSLTCADINGIIPVQGYDVAHKCITFIVVPFRFEVGKCVCVCVCVWLVTLVRWCVTQHIATFCIPVMSLMIQQRLKSLILIFPVSWLIFHYLLTSSSSCTSWTFSFRMFGLSACWLYLVVSNPGLWCTAVRYTYLSLPYVPHADHMPLLFWYRSIVPTS
jgi:hypothetical protein